MIGNQLYKLYHTIIGEVMWGKGGGINNIGR
jgi:hypothetical protein